MPKATPRELEKKKKRTWTALRTYLKENTGSASKQAPLTRPRAVLEKHDREGLVERAPAARGEHLSAVAVTSGQENVQSEPDEKQLFQNFLWNPYCGHGL